MYVSVYLCVRVSVLLCVCVCTCLYAYVTVCLLACQAVRQSICLSGSSSVNLPARLLACLLVCQSFVPVVPVHCQCLPASGILVSRPADRICSMFCLVLSWSALMPEGNRCLNVTDVCMSLMSVPCRRSWGPAAAPHRHEAPRQPPQGNDGGPQVVAVQELRGPLSFRWRESANAYLLSDCAYPNVVSPLLYPNEISRHV